MRGVFISFEGGEGCGKSTQIRRLAKRLEGMGRKVVQTREPGGTHLGEAIRHLLKHSPAGYGMCAESEMLLFSAARAELVRKVIQPALAEGAVVLSDRFLDSTTVYQGIVRGLDPKLVASAHRMAVGACVPQMTLLFVLPVAEGRRRVMRRVRPVGGKEDRFEAESDEFHGKVLLGFLQLAKSEPKRFKVVDARRSIADVEAAVWEYVKHVI
ncbi:MAG: dTMP kinase [Verrucomicrobia bacterium]|nr:dTMP kinase [Verrucomicrobiota bacterium]